MPWNAGGEGKEEKMQRNEKEMQRVCGVRGWVMGWVLSKWERKRTREIEGIKRSGPPSRRRVKPAAAAAGEGDTSAPPAPPIQLAP